MELKKISIIGVGLIGGSFALALKERGFKGSITGIGRNSNRLAMAMDLGIIDNFTTDHIEGVRDADLILLATPVGQFENIVKNIKNDLRPGTIVTDAGSVKAEIINRVGPLIPEDVYFIAGHPIAGKEDSGFGAAEPDLFSGANCIITPTPSTDRTALKTVIELWEKIGSNVILMDSEEHDKIFAAVSHLPHVIAYALVNTLSKEDGNIMEHGGGGLKDMIRIASSPPELWKDICSYNKNNLLKSLKVFSSSISGMIELIEKSDWEGLEKEFLKAQEEKRIVESD